MLGLTLSRRCRLKITRRIVAALLLVATLGAVSYWFWWYRIRPWSDAEVASWRASAAQEVEEKSYERGHDSAAFDLGAHNDVVFAKILGPYVGMLLLLIVGLAMAGGIYPWPKPPEEKEPETANLSPGPCGLGL